MLASYPNLQAINQRSQSYLTNSKSRQHDTAAVMQPPTKSLENVQNVYVILPPPPSISCRLIRHPGGAPSQSPFFVDSPPGVLSAPCWITQGVNSTQSLQDRQVGTDTHRQRFRQVVGRAEARLRYCGGVSEAEPFAVAKERPCQETEEVVQGAQATRQKALDGCTAGVGAWGRAQHGNQVAYA